MESPGSYCSKDFLRELSSPSTPLEHDASSAGMPCEKSSSVLSLAFGFGLGLSLESEAGHTETGLKSS